MSKTLVFGHKNPDTDTICSAIAYSSLKNALGETTEPVRLGEIADETRFVLDYFAVETPRLIGDVAAETDKVMLVDHNEAAQSADGIENVEILEVVDHHRIAFETSGPLYYRAEPVGCTATIIMKMFRENNVEITKSIAGLLVSAIISDTLLFKSPTCTKEDELAARELAAIAGIDVESYGLSQLKAGASIAGKSATDLINIDSKPFTMGANKVEIAQINVVEIADGLAMKAELLAAMEAARTAKSQDVFLVLITDILNNNSVGLVSGSTALVEKAFNAEVVNNIIDLPGVVSRKKQVVPVMTDAA